MRDQLKKLEELQKYDAQIQELTNALSAIPAKLEASRNDLTRVEGLLASERAQIARDPALPRRAEEPGSDRRGAPGQRQEQAVGCQEHQGVRGRPARAGRDPGKPGRARDRDHQAGRGHPGQEEAARRTGQRRPRPCAPRSTKDGEQAKARMAEIEAKHRRAAEPSATRSPPRSGPDVLKRYGAIRMRKGLAMASASATAPVAAAT